MPDIHHTTPPMKADPERVYRAAATKEGLAAFWTDQIEGRPEIGGVIEFGFGPNRETVFDMRVERLDEPKLVEWSCVGGPDEWVGTRVAWEIEPANGGSRVKFHHTDWRRADGVMPDCSFVWAMILDRLSKYVETGQPGPYFAR